MRPRRDCGGCFGMVGVIAVRFGGGILRYGQPCAARGLCGEGPVRTGVGGRERRVLLEAAKGRFRNCEPSRVPLAFWLGPV